MKYERPFMIMFSKSSFIEIYEYEEYKISMLFIQKNMDMSMEFCMQSPSLRF